MQYRVQHHILRFAVSICAAMFALSGVAVAVEPDDVPWDDIDRVLKENPATPEAPANSNAQVPRANLETPAKAAPPQPASETSDQATAAPVSPPAPAVVTLTPPIETPTAAAPPVVTPPAAAAAAPSADVPSPNSGTPVQDDTAAAPSAPPPVTVPENQVAHAPDPATAPLYLPLAHYFETRAAVMLRDFDKTDRDALQKFYTARLNQSLWTNLQGFNAAAQNLIAEIKAADDWGLSAADYKIPGLTKIGGGEFRDEDLADAEIKLSLVAMQYANHARGGRIEDPTAQLSSYIDRKPQLIDRSKFLENLASSAPLSGEYLRTLHPRHEQFERLRQKLIALRKNGPAADIEKIPDGPKLTPGKTHWQIALVRRRLDGPAPQAPKADGTVDDATFYDEALARKVEDFKRENAIEPVNTSITAALRRALNADTRVSEETILANMEEWRWMPEDLGATHIFVNIPEFLVRVVKNNSIIHEERIVSGKVDTQTPIFSGKMRTVVFQPDWKVPESIKITELLPGLRAGSNPIERQGLTLERNGRKLSAWDVDWESADIRQYNVYQAPGDRNVLGVVKFLFPNKHSVYLHDTPSKSLFNEKVRTFSHGCMRVRNPVQLAEVIMREDKGWDKERVDELVSSGPEDNSVSLSKTLPVHVTYFTAWVNDAGELKTFGDVYGHEKRIVLGLEGRWNDIVKNRDHLLPPEDIPVASAADDDNYNDYNQERAGRSANRARLTYREGPPPPPVYRKRGTFKGTAYGDFLSNFLSGGF